ncbi:MAG: S8 family serine peptidase [Pseudotabrizicola sp.]|uniref:S8 family serine peptidase n=1 Tax=Pseudotabrizicola sp. TaxID=2939647 RepID=UPI0027306ACC|nr:S8 family serine peptidase [Pseudotabrizicola sp.]MDP2083436.1 S8 family serine peptidase [Pseudotabrizicola sp.]MDZ7572821.1 S8 family serine peptidase [Pseudotabrizicola sp.]
MDSDSTPKTTRRALLRRIGLAAGLSYVAPGLSALGVARASGSSGPSGPSGVEPRGSDRNPTHTRRQQAQRRRPAAPNVVPEILILLGAEQSLTPAVEAGYRVLDEADSGGLSGRLARLGLPGGRTIEAALAELAQLIPGALADENHLYAPDDFTCTGEDCAAHAMIGWSGWPSAMAPRIGMIDTGVNVDHPTLSGQKLTVHQLDLADRAAAGRQHGTAIAAMLIGSVAGRVPGLLPYAELIAVEGFHRGATGEVADAFSIIRGMDILLTESVSVINLSFSGPANTVLERMVIRADVAGVAMVAAAGNGGPGAAPAYPAAWGQVIAVTAVDASAQPYRQANRGPYVMLAAPGVNVWTAASVSGGRLRSGTSYAAPFVTASLAIERMRAPDLALSEVTQSLFDCARDLGEAGFDDTFGYGLLSAPAQCNAENAELFSVSGE